MHGRTLALPQMECHARCPSKQHMGCSLVAVRSQTALSEGVLILVLLSWTFLAGSGLAAHPGQSDSTAVPACGHHHAAHHGQGPATTGREAPSPAPAGPAPPLLRGRRYLVSLLTVFCHSIQISSGQQPGRGVWEPSSPCLQCQFVWVHHICYYLSPVTAAWELSSLALPCAPWEPLPV